MEKPRFEFYTRPNGHNEFLEYYHHLPKKDRTKLFEVILNVQSDGLIIAEKMQWVKKLDDNLFELRSKFGSNIQRVLYFRVEETRFIVTHGFTKKTEQTPAKEIRHAKVIRKEFYSEVSHHANY
mgnify:CR=1 FL=1